ncbi:thiamine-phosphate kinase [Alkalicoccobacillus porphyridii]|uniref:Thiamine-monophosphate kinase n=1 Tax=Alkalicoccobacillus porphyridii TaxID=2597270 RepID=A0A553ZTZ1_9BACI|nr:thiamine-phosphate kinase [Alkalicoccobacillus porphyridii]TSB44940.1 thiamine-phosphate kinase [Alkalicoccobacillus porphyridii]
MKDEFAFINMIKPREYKQSTLVMGIGDDAAVYRPSKGMREVICLDTMIEGIHFTKETLSPEQIGQKALAINISDLAAMGAIPRYYLVSVAIPSSWSDTELKAIYQGMSSLSDRYEMDLIGGDTVSAKESLVLTVTAIGQVEEGVEFFRSQAKPGDTIFVTGTIGSSAAGLALLLKHGRSGKYSDSEKQLVILHQEPEPQVIAGRLFASKCTRMALNDISDGLASESHEIAEASGVSLYINEESIPLHNALLDTVDSVSKRVEYALNGGEDFQLIGTVSSTEFDELIKDALKKGIVLTPIGEVREKAEQLVYIVREGSEEPLAKNGYNHFK